MINVKKKKNITTIKTTALNRQWCFMYYDHNNIIIYIIFYLVSYQFSLVMLLIRSLFKKDDNKQPDARCTEQHS